MPKLNNGITNSLHASHNTSQIITNIILSNTKLPATLFKTNFDHSYALEYPSKMKAKINKLVYKLNKKKAALHNIKRREKKTK